MRYAITAILLGDGPMPTSITGRCFCGAVRFQFDHTPIAVRTCWCRDCQYLAAGNASVNAIFRTEGFICAGDLGVYVSNADSGSVMRRNFCLACGTQLFSRSDRRPQLIVVRVGTLDDPSIGQPQVTIWTASAPAWARLDPDLPRFEGQPPAVSPTP
jgi:hypothetical protein